MYSANCAESDMIEISCREWKPTEELKHATNPILAGHGPLARANSAIVANHPRTSPSGSRSANRSAVMRSTARLLSHA